MGVVSGGGVVVVLALVLMVVVALMVEMVDVRGVLVAVMFL